MKRRFKAYFGGSFDENQVFVGPQKPCGQVRKHFVLIYELLLGVFARFAA